MTSELQRAGRWRTNLKGGAAFESFVPADLQSVEIAYNDDLATRLAEAEVELGNLRAAYATLSEEERAALAQTLLDREATSSCELAADRAPAMPVFGSGDGALPIIDTNALLHAPEDKDEIEHLKEAMQYAADPFDGLPLSRRLLTRAHFLATQGPRYEKKYPGEVRRSPNWMGEPDAPLSKAKIVFPTGDDLDYALARLEHYIHEDRRHPELVKVALAHYQFEVIHPFIDANGRIGRLLTNLMLANANRIPPVMLPISDTLNIYAGRYYELLELVETEGAYEQWVSFFLGVIREAAAQAAKSCRPS